MSETTRVACFDATSDYWPLGHYTLPEGYPFPHKGDALWVDGERWEVAERSHWWCNGAASISLNLRPYREKRGRFW